MKTETITLPSGSPNTLSQLTVWRFGTPRAEGQKKVYIQASLHADEWPGMLVAYHLYELFTQAEKDGKINGEIVVVPVANPIGLRQFLGGYQLGRFDFDYSGNFNRGYLDLAAAAADKLDKNALLKLSPCDQVQTIRAAFARALDDWQPLLESEQLRKTLQTLAFDADFVLDLHCDAQACAHAFANIRHQETAEALAEALGAEVLLLEDDPGGMAFDEAASSPWWRLEKLLNCALPYPTFATTVELRGERDINDLQGKKDAAALFRFLEHVDVITGGKTLTINQKRGTPLEGVARILAPTTGLLVFHCQVGEAVEKGQLIAELLPVTDPTQARVPLCAPTTGKIYAFGRNHLVRSGHVVAQIAGAERIGTGGLAF